MRSAMRRTLRTTLGAGICTALLAGCGGALFSKPDQDTCEPPSPPAACRCPPPEASPVLELLEYHRYAHVLSLPELEIELRQRAALLESGACTLDRLRVALLLQRRPPEDNEAAFDDLLRPCLEGPGTPSLPLRHLAHLLRARLEERREQHKRLRELDQSLKAERQRTAELTQQLEALKDIERSILERERGERSQQDAARAPRRPTAQGKTPHGP